MGGSIAYALFVEGSAGGLGITFSAPSFGIVFGGMMAYFRSLSDATLLLGKAIGAVLKPADDKMGPLVDEAVEVADVGHKERSIREKAVDGIRIIFKDGVQMVVDGYSLEELAESWKQGLITEKKENVKNQC